MERAQIFLVRRWRPCSNCGTPSHVRALAHNPCRGLASSANSPSGETRAWDRRRWAPVTSAPWCIGRQQPCRSERGKPACNRAENTAKIEWGHVIRHPGATLTRRRQQNNGGRAHSSLVQTRFIRERAARGINQYDIGSNTCRRSTASHPASLARLTCRRPVGWRRCLNEGCSRWSTPECQSNPVPGRAARKGEGQSRTCDCRRDSRHPKAGR